jgi:hypothetical protein
MLVLIHVRLLHILHERVVFGGYALLNHGCIHIFGELVENQVFGNGNFYLGTNSSRVLICELGTAPVSMRSFPLSHHRLEAVLDASLSLLAFPSSDGSRVILTHDELFHDL